MNNKLSALTIALGIIAAAAILGLVYVSNNQKDTPEQPAQVKETVTVPKEEPAVVQVEEKVQTDIPPATPPKEEVAKKEEPAPPAETDVADESYDAGMVAYEAKNGAEALECFSKSGSAKSYYMIGVIYENGCGGVGQNKILAMQNFKKAASLGYEKANIKLR